MFSFGGGENNSMSSNKVLTSLSIEHFKSAGKLHNFRTFPQNIQD